MNDSGPVHPLHATGWQQVPPQAGGTERQLVTESIIMTTLDRTNAITDHQGLCPHRSLKIAAGYWSPSYIGVGRNQT